MPSPKPKKTDSELLECTYLSVRQIKNLVKQRPKSVQLSSAQVKHIWACLQTVTLYLEQKEEIKKTQIQKIFETRTALEREYKEQTGKRIDQ